MRVLVLTALLFLPLTAQSAEPVNPEGYWLASAKQDVVIHIQRCEGDTLCGTTHWVSRKDREAALCNRRTLWGLEQNAQNPNLWENGTIFRAHKDEYYGGKINFISEDKLTLRGYLGFSILGKDYDFKRVNQDDYAACSPVPEQFSKIN